MTRPIAVGLCAFVLAGLMCFAEAAETTRTITLDFSQKALRAEERYLADDSVLNTPFHLVALGDLDIMTEPGKPCLPVKIVHMYVPRGSEIGGVVVESQSTVSLPGEYLILPGQREIPLSSFERAEAVMPDQETYASDKPYPASPVSVASVGSMAGRPIASLQVFPVQYVPAERRLIFNQRITFSVVFRDAEALAAPAVPRETASVAAARNEIVARMVENDPDIEPDFLSTGTLEGPTAAEYLLICHENHADEYSLLTNWKTRKGVPAAIKTWQEIVAEYSGRDNAEKIRNCIRDYYLNYSTMWVTMSGSAPKAYDYLRGCYGNAEGTVDDFIACDLYFSDLDGTWNDDNDTYWGETTDSTDLYPDIYVGRLPENAGIQCSTAVHKVLTYEGRLSLPSDYQLAMLFMAEWVDVYTDGAICKNMIDDESVPARFDPVQRLYQSSGNLDHASAMDALNSGKGVVNHFGHGMPGKISIGEGTWLTMDDFMALTNAPRYTIFYTSGCTPAAFDVDQGCLGRSFVESPGGGGFFVGNSSPGFYWQGNPGYGTGDMYDREFFKSMFVRGYSNLGVVHADAKVQRIPYSGEYGTDRWTLFSMNLLGDPETPVWVDTPESLSVSHPTEIETQSQTFTVSVSSGGSPVGQARVCLWKGDDVYRVSQTASDGSAAFSIAPADTGTMLVTVTKSGYIPYLGSTAVEIASSGVAAGGLGARALRVTPNPTRGGATTRFLLPRYLIEAGGAVGISIYDARGRLVATLSSEANPSASSIAWDARTQGGARVPPGVYFLKARCGDASTETKLVILK
ncbi:MAG: C25 family cysteine peptidase [bacterium]